MSIGSPTAKRSDIEIKSTKPEKDHPSKEPHLKPSTRTQIKKLLNVQSCIFLKLCLISFLSIKTA